jgi:hypothetical protein
LAGAAGARGADLISQLQGAVALATIRLCSVRSSGLACESHAIVFVSPLQQRIPHAALVVGLVHGDALALTGIAATIKASEQISRITKAVLPRTTRIIPFNGPEEGKVPFLREDGEIAYSEIVKHLTK